jgi:hypothetical protein
MAVSIALLGFGASGSFLFLFPNLMKQDENKLLGILSLLFSYAAMASYWVTNNLPLDSFRIGVDRFQILYLAVEYLALIIPFFFAGLIIGVAISKSPQHISKLYFLNLTGSAIGCILALPIAASGEKGICFVVWSGLIACFLFLLPLIKTSSFRLDCHGLRPRNDTWLLLFFLATCILSLFIPSQTNLYRIRLSEYKTLSQSIRAEGASILLTEWNPFSRVDVIKSPIVRVYPGLSYIYPSIPPEQLGITIDGENLSGVTRFSGRLEELKFTDYLPQASGFILKENKKLLLINPRGGLDLLTALYHKMTPITVIEENPLVMKVLKSDLKEFCGNLYDRNGIEVKSETARSFIGSTPDTFDIIHISLSDSFGPVSSGAFSLSENHTLTKEAFAGYLNILSPDGIISMVRWLQFPPSEELKVMAGIVEAVEAMETEGITNPNDNIISFRTWNTATFLVKKLPFTMDEIGMVKKFCKDRRFDLIYAPGITRDEVNIYDVFPQDYHFQTFSELLATKDKQKFYRDYSFNISPITDDMPFFFHFFKWRQLPVILKNIGREWKPYAGAGYLVIIIILIIALLISFILIVLPLLIRKDVTINPVQQYPPFLYFLSLGIGFIFIEICLMQKFILFLGHPIYAFSIVLFSILFFSGLGSLCIKRWIDSPKTPFYFLSLLILTIFLYPFLLPFVFKSFLKMGFPMRVFISIVSLAPISFLMGIPFPCGIRVLSRNLSGFIPHVWGVNGFASVISSIVSMMIAVSMGYSILLILAGFSYIVALFAMQRMQVNASLLMEQMRLL